MCAFSRLSLFFIKIPSLLATPDDTTMASGVANPRLHGHATTKTVINTFMAKPKVWPITSHTIADTTANIIIAGTK